MRVKIGLSFDQGSAKYRLYAGAVLAAAEEAQIDIQPIWLAGAERQTNRTAIETIDGLILTGGADVEPHRYGFRDANHVCATFPGRDDAEWQILDAAFARRLPMLAICRGMQLLNVFAGGTLVPDLPATGTHQLDDGQRHRIEIEGGSALGMLVGHAEGEVSSSHHQAVAKLGSGLQVAARHADGTIEAIEWTHPMRKPWLAAVQWHPERMGLDEPFSGELFRGFLQAVALARV
ncbi:MAG TPA: gamma-glutamyl-gamma-aminobutyrate hydrolase family protein [Stellaceae bacterium]|nr:gamma-glutamyl-gamma-aminobutyrate hydrolase family protein [Stellaceae bacterium]